MVSSKDELWERERGDEWKVIARGLQKRIKSALTILDAMDKETSSDSRDLWPHQVLLRAVLEDDN